MSQKPLVIHVVEAFGGGVFESIRQLCEGTAEDFDILIVHSIRPQTPGNYKELLPGSVQFLHLPMVRAINPKADITHARALRTLFKKRKPSFIHAHSSKAGALVRMAALGLGIPTGYSPRGYAFLMADQSAKKRIMYQGIEALLGFLPTTTIACGHDEGAIARKISRRTAVIPNAIRLDEYPLDLRTRPPITNGMIVIGSGRISPQKNFPLFCEVAGHFAGSNLHFIWVGGAEGDIQPTHPHVTVTGWLSQKQAHAVLNTGHIYLHMSGWEGLSRALLEAMAHGFPLIASNVVGNRELTSAGNGFLCENKKDVIKALETFQSDPTLIGRMGSASLAHVTTHYNWATSLNLWKDLCRNAPSAAR